MTINDVARFMRLGGQTVPDDVDADAGPHHLIHYLERVESELLESWDATLPSKGPYGKIGSVADTVDGFLDTAYAAMTGAIRLVGEEKAARCWEAIVDANLAKVDGRHGPPVQDTRTGKILKPDGWTPPAIQEILDE